MSDAFDHATSTVPTVNTKSLRAILAYASRRGMDENALLSAAGVSAEMFGSPDSRVRRDRVHAIWLAMEKELNDSAIALEVGRAFPFGTYDVLDYVFATSKTVRSGVENLLAYLRLLIDQAALELIEDGNGIIRYEMFNDRDGFVRFSSEFSFAVLMDRVRGCADIDDWNPVAVRFAHPAVADPARYESYFGCPVEFGAASNEIELPAAVIQAPMRRADPGLNNVLQRHATAVLESIPVSVTFDDSVRRELYRAITEGAASPGIEEIAERLAMGTRTLQRRLREVDTTFAALLDELRFEFATRFLADPTMTVGEVGFLLGFSEPSAFNRAFRRWAGDTPGGFRKRVLAE